MTASVNNRHTRVAAPRWATDPSMRHRLRYWTGEDWSAWVADDSPDAAIDPLDPTEHYLAPGAAVDIVASPMMRSGVRHRSGRAGAIIYGIYVVVFSFVGISWLLNEPGRTSFEMFMVGAALVALVPLIRTLERATSVIFPALAVGLIASVVIPLGAYIVFFARTEWSSTALAVLFLLWAATLVAVAYTTRFVARHIARRPRDSTSAPPARERDAEDTCYLDSLTGALFGAHFGAIVLGLALAQELDHMGPVRPSYLFGVYLGDYWPHPGDWRLTIPVALVAMVSLVAGLAIDLVRWRGWPPSRAAALGHLAFAFVAIIAIATSVGLLASWWTVVPTGGDASVAALAVVPAYALGVAVITLQWRPQQTADAHNQGANSVRLSPTT